MDDLRTISVVDPVAFAAALALEGDGKEQVRSAAGDVSRVQAVVL